MEANTEEFYYRVILKIVEDRLGSEIRLKALIAEKWKDNFIKRLRKPNRRRNSIASEEEKKTSHGSLGEFEDEFELPECESLCFGKLKKIVKKPKVFIAKLSGCCLKLKNNQEYAFPNITLVLKNDIF